METKSELMGKWVCVKKRFVRRHHGAHRTWCVEETAVFSGWIVGFRTIQNGYTEYSYSEYGGGKEGGPYWVAEGHIPCVLVCTNPHENPVNVPVSEVYKYLENAKSDRLVISRISQEMV